MKTIFMNDVMSYPNMIENHHVCIRIKIKSNYFFNLMILYLMKIEMLVKKNGFLKEWLTNLVKKDIHLLSNSNK